MGQAKRKIEMKVNLSEMHRQKMAQRKQFVKTFPERLLKLCAGALLFIPLTMVCFGWECFKKNEWPWSPNL